MQYSFMMVTEWHMHGPLPNRPSAADHNAIVVIKTVWQRPLPNECVAALLNAVFCYDCDGVAFAWASPWPVCWCPSECSVQLWWWQSGLCTGLSLISLLLSIWMQYSVMMVTEWYTHRPLPGQPVAAHLNAVFCYDGDRVVCVYTVSYTHLTLPTRRTV